MKASAWTNARAGSVRAALAVLLIAGLTVATSPAQAGPSTEACGLLAGTGAVLAGEWEDGAIRVRDGATILWYPRQGTPQRATLHEVRDNGRWPYMTVSIGPTEYLILRQGDRVLLHPRPTGFVTGEEPGYARWLDRWIASDPQRAEWPLAIVPALRVQPEGDCPGVPRAPT